MSLLSAVFYLGANARVQAIRFGLCLALGLVAGVIALLYLRKARPVERALTDFFATVCIGGLFIVCIEFFLDGKFELYGLAAFAIGIIPIPLITRKILTRKQTSHTSSDCTQADDDDLGVSKNKDRLSHPLGNGKQTESDKKHADDGNFISDKKFSPAKNAAARKSYAATVLPSSAPYEYEAVAYESPEDKDI